MDRGAAPTTNQNHHVTSAGGARRFLRNKTGPDTNISKTGVCVSWWPGPKILGQINEQHIIP